MAMPVTEKNLIGVTSPQVLMFPDHYVAFTYKLSKQSSLAGDPVDGKYIVKAGTIFPANDDTAVGVILNDYDVTNGDAHAAIVVHGFFSVHKLRNGAPTPEAEEALKQISFFPLKTTRVNVRYNNLEVGKAGGSIIVQVSGTRFKPAQTAGTTITIDAGTTGLTAGTLVVDPNGRYVEIPFTGTATAGEISVTTTAAAFVNNKAGNVATAYVPNTESRTDKVSKNDKG